MSEAGWEEREGGDRWRREGGEGGEEGEGRERKREGENE